ncbi:hypothetical protein R3W88_000978 [Solanum pinnatisectum]|uniref:Polyprotein protein n=1 Tax=Solanum pinnatisectum TaxID=50273 RepID=A0AAV9MHM7_9SOLN|nr:hypothetical protein R3W88_000978 [Solanum pinnatisectum]
MIDAYGFALHFLIVRVEICEQGEGASMDVTTLKAHIIGMRRYVDELKSTNLSMLFGTVHLHELWSTYVPASSEIPQATMTRDVSRDEAATKSEAKTNDEALGVREAVTYDDFEDLKGAMVQTTIEESLRDTSMVGSNGAKNVIEPSTDVQTEGVIDMQCSPQA